MTRSPQPTPPNAPQPTLRVAEIMQYFDVGGIESLVSRLAVQSRPYGVEMLVIAYLGDGPLRQQLNDAGVQTLLLPGAGGIQPQRIWQLRAALRRFGADVVHTHHLGPLLYGGLAARSLGVPIVHTEHSVEWAERPRLRLLAALASHGVTVTAVSEAVAQARQTHVPPPVQVVDNGVPVRERVPAMREAVRAELGLPLDAPVIGCVARLAAEKNHALLIAAFAQVLAARPDAHLLLIGDGPERARLEQQAAACGGNVHFLGLRQDVGRLLQAMDMMALASEREGQPLALLEGMGAALPVVATAVGGVPLLLRDGAGTLVPAGDMTAMAEGLLALVTRPELARSMGDTGQALVARKYSETAMLQHYLRIWRQAAQGAA